MPLPMARKSARYKQQTRLAFDPIDHDLHSSPPATNLTPANVRYHLPNRRGTPSSSRNTYTFGNSEDSEDPLSSGKKTKMPDSNMKENRRAKARAKIDGKLSLKALLTPAKSSQTIGTMVPEFSQNPDIEEPSEGEIRNNNIRAAYGSPANSERFINRMGTSARNSRPRPEVDLDESDGSPAESETETPTKRNKGKQKVVSWNQAHPSDEVQQTSENLDLPERHHMSTRKSTTPISAQKTKSRIKKVITLSSDSDSESMYRISKNLHERTSGAPKKQILDVDKGDERGDVRRALPSQTRQRLPSGKSQRQAILAKDDSDDEDVISSSVNRRRSRNAETGISSPSKKRGQPVASDSEDSDIRSSPWKRRKQVNHDEEYDDSDLPSVKDITLDQRAKSRSSSSASTIPNRVTRQAKAPKHRTEREKKLELLRRKRAGEDIEDLTDSSIASSEPRRGIYDSDSYLEMLDDFDDESEPEIIRKPQKKKTPNLDNYQLSDDSDFVVEDDEDDTIGVPPLGLLDIPLKFRHTAHKPMKEHFKDAVEWMVHRKINPAFSRNDEVYLQAFTKLDDEYMGYAKSKFVSTQWTAEFTRAIYARPILIERPCGPGEGYTIDGLPKCDVCNHRRHIPKFAIHFEGKAYYKSTLEEVEYQDSEESDVESDDATSVNSNGQSLPAEDKEWFSGSVCRDNARQAHALIHWKFALNEWVVDQLEYEGYLTPEKLAEREKMKTKKRREYANQLVDGWAAEGIIQNLYRDFKGQLEAARESKQGRWQRGRYQGFGADD